MEFLKCLAEEIGSQLAIRFPSSFVIGWGFGGKQTETVTLPLVWEGELAPGYRDHLIDFDFFIVCFRGDTT